MTAIEVALELYARWMDAGDRASERRFWGYLRNLRDANPGAHEVVIERLNASDRRGNGYA